MDKPWISTKSAAAALGISYDYLLKLRSKDLLKIGQHWRDIRLPSSARATYRWNLKACQETLGNLTTSKPSPPPH